MVYSKTITVSSILILIVVLLFPLTVLADVTVDVFGGVNHSIHGINIVKDTLFGENVGSGGYGGADKINATWFRSTSPCNILRGAVESTNNPGLPDKAWLAGKYPLSGVNEKKSPVNKVNLFHVKANKADINWPPRPFTGRAGSESQAKSWAEICAAYIGHAMRPYKDGTSPKIMWEFGNEVMWSHYLKTPSYDMDPNRQGPHCNGANAALAYRKWVYYAAQAIRDIVPNAYIMAGSGDMISYSNDWWGWKYWDKPFLDLCASNIDAYATHWYSSLPEQISLEATLIYNYTRAHYNKGIPTHVTEYNIPNLGALSSNDLQWCRTRYETAVLFSALRDPDKIVGLYRFIWSDPKFTPKFQVKGSILEKWLMMTREMRGTRLLAESDSQSVKSLAVQSGKKIVALICNSDSATQNIKINIHAPENNRIKSYSTATLAYDAVANNFIYDVKTNVAVNAEFSLAVPLSLTEGASAVLTVELENDTKIDHIVHTKEFIAKNVMIPSDKTIRIKTPAENSAKYAMLRLGIEVRSSRWTDLWVSLNGHIYQLPAEFWRRPCRQIAISIDPKHIKQNNILHIYSAGKPDVTVITAAIEISDIAMTTHPPRCFEQAVILSMPEKDIFAWQNYIISLQTSDTSDKKFNPENIKFSLPEGWKIEPDKLYSDKVDFKIHIPQQAGVDWYPVNVTFNLGGEKYTLESQVRVNTPVQCDFFDQAPIVDGDLSDWNGHPPAEISVPQDQNNELIWMPGHRNDYRTGKTMRTGWTKGGFYFAAEFNADKPVGSWLDLFFDMNADRTIAHYDRNDHQFKIKLEKNGQAGIKQIIWSGRVPRMTIAGQHGSTACWKQKDNAITVEGFIPAAEFYLFNPWKGNLIGFDFRINNYIEWYSRAYEQAQNQFPGTKSWGKEQTMSNPAVWGWLRFN